MKVDEGGREQVSRGLDILARQGLCFGANFVPKGIESEIETKNCGND